MANTDSEPVWVTKGLKDLGFHEKKNNRGIEKFIEQAHCGEVGDPWCAIWTNAKLEQSGIQGTRSARALSFSENKSFVKLDKPALGAITVYTRGKPSARQGHVGFYMGETSTQILTLGGNESDAVREQFEPKSRLVGFFWPKSVDLPKGGAIKVKASDGHPVGSVT
jgi:uncharacterized protein (TIGR02594 family)